MYSSAFCGNATKGPRKNRSPLDRSVQVVACLDQIEMQHLDGVATNNLVKRLVVEVNGHLANELFGMGPSRVRVGVIGFERDVVDADVIKILQTEVVTEETGVDLTTEVEFGRFADDCGVECPAAEFRPHVMGPLKEVRDPAHLCFGIRQRDVRETGEDAGEDPVSQ